MNLEELRAEIDTIDDNLLQDFAQRMNVVGQIGLEKILIADLICDNNSSSLIFTLI